MISGIACHISSDTALRRAGLLKTSQPIGPSISAIMRSVGDFMTRSSNQISSNHAVGAQPRDRRSVVAELAQHVVGMLAALRRWLAQRRGRAAQRHRLADEIDLAQDRMLDRLGDAEMLDLRIGEGLVDVVD